MKPGGQRIKGHSFERRVANDLKRFFPDAKRGFQTRGGGKEQADIIGTPFHIECKHHKKVNLYAALNQATDDLGDSGLIPVAIGKSNRGPVRVLMFLSDLVNLTDHNCMLDPEVELDYGSFLYLIGDRFGEAKQ